MEGKLPILLLFVILNNAFSSPHVSSRSNDASRSKNDSHSSSLGQQNKNPDGPNVSTGNKVDNEPTGHKIYYQRQRVEENEGGFERPLSVGDTFTPTELLPVTQKLIAKVDNPGEGKGIVSGAKSPEDLADKLFTNFFFSNKRIVKLDEHDISGLDALQALALSGQVTSLRSHANVPVTESYATISFRGHTIAVNAEPIKSKYTLLTKSDNKKIRKKIVIRRGGIKIAENLLKNRHVIVNPGRKHNSAGKLSKKAGRSGNKRVNSKARAGNEKQGSKKYCHWMYYCTNPTDLDTCRLKTDCTKDTPVVEFHGVPHQPDEHTPSMRQLRKMMGISLVDEEVEKILEMRYIKARPLDGRPGPDMARLESLTEYFNNIILLDFKKSTKPIKDPKTTTEAYRGDGQNDNFPKQLEPVQSEQSEKSGESSEGGQRRAFEPPTRSTPKPTVSNLTPKPSNQNL